MAVTILGSLMIMVGYFLLLYAGVGLIQDKRFFSSAPKENLAVIPDKKERFRGAHILGWMLGIFARKTGMIRQKIIPVLQLPIDKEGHLRSPG